MKFWHKIFIGTFIIFILCFNIGVYYLTSYSYNFNRQRETEHGIREQEVILSSIANRIENAENFYPDISHNNERLTAIISPLADFYRPQGVLLALFHDGSPVYNDISNIDSGLLALDDTGQKNIMEETISGKRHIIVASQLPDHPHLTFIYARDISQIDEFRADISRAFTIVNIIILVFLGISIFLLIKHMTKPITKLTKTAAEIANGAYEKRVNVSSKDELGALAGSFNRMADSVEEQMKHLTRSAEEKQQFIDDLTHEIKTPLTSILGYSEYLQKAKSTEKERIIAVGYLNETAIRLKTLSEKLLDLTFSRDENIEMKALNTETLFTELTAMTLPILAPRNQRLITLADAPIIVGEETLLLSMLRNLIENAARASKDGTSITIRAYEESHLIIEVIDTGRGMEQHDVERIMAPFYRVDKSRSRKFGGVGLGLSIVSQIASLHGARIEVESKIGKGTIVRLHFTSL